jgi:hypothetical protein
MVGMKVLHSIFSDNLKDIGLRLFGFETDELLAQLRRIVQLGERS